MTDSPEGSAGERARSDAPASSGDGDGSTPDDVDAGGSADSDGTYSGVFGAFPYAFRASQSRLFRSYAVVGGFLAAVVVLLFALAVVVLVGDTASSQGGTLTFSRAFFVFLMMLVVGPLVAPILSVARRHRRQGSSVAYDRAVALGAYLFVATLYLGLIISTPDQQQEAGSGSAGLVLDALYSLPREAGAIPPILAAALIYLLHRRYR